MEVRLNPVEFAKAMMKKKKQLIPTPIVLDNGIAGIMELPVLCMDIMKVRIFIIWIDLMVMFLKKKN